MKKIFCLRQAFIVQVNKPIAIQLFASFKNIIPKILNNFHFLFCFSVAAVDGWRKFLEKERRYIAKAGLPHHKKLVDEVKQVEEALIKHEDVNTLKLFKILNAVSTQLLPYIQNEKARRIHSGLVDDVNKLIASSEAHKLGKEDLHNFIRKAYKSISAL